MRNHLPLLPLFLILAVACNDKATTGPVDTPEPNETDATATLEEGFVENGAHSLYYKTKILYDQCSTGLSSGPVDSDSVNIDTFIDDIEAIREHFGIEKMNLLGHSWGGRLAMHYSLRHQDRTVPRRSAAVFSNSWQIWPKTRGGNVHRTGKSSRTGAQSGASPPQSFRRKHQ
ncbi:MAG: alpha/beta fold hydrolase [bacterium]|nr:alpha/beta fold hydrolase [bacterium]